MHPNGTNSAPYEVEYATRRFDYTGPTEANVQITGHFSKFNDPSATVGDGVDGYILLNGVTIDTFYSNSVTNQFTTPLNIPALQSGDVLDFVVGPGPHGNDGADHTDYEVNIATSAPLPSTALGGFALLGGLIGWRLRRRAQARP
ncbi:MAG TPA: hypothetical protein VFC78_11780 [Tepidisphaeraceae bacterium]|nr:hypothetical protein [Tepidisphaeraceae bacterium]